MNRVKEALVVLMGLSVATMFFSAFFLKATVPHVSDVAFGVFPFLAFTYILSFVVSSTVARERESQSFASALFVTCVASAGAFLLSLCNAWNDGTYYAVLPPLTALTSIGTLGILPFRMGPDALVRFLPVLTVAGLLFRFRRSNMPMPKRIGVAIVAYLVLAFSVHSLSWISGGLSMSRGEPLTGPADAYKVLVSVQSDGYWTRAQGDRFFAPIGSQSENSFAGIQSAIVLFVIVILLLVCAVRAGRPLILLLKRLKTRSMLLLSLMVVSGAALGISARGPVRSYTDALAFVVLAVAIVSWLMWWRLAKDISTIARDEAERPHLPIPSGAVSMHDAEIAKDVLGAVSLIAAFLLGWPVFLPFCSATIVVIAFPSIKTANARFRIAIETIGTSLVACGIGFAVASMALRDESVPAWIFRILFAIALLIGLECMLRRAEHVHPSRFVQAGLLGVGSLAAFLLAHQRAYWLFFLPTLALTILLARNDASWGRFRSFPVLFAVIGFACIAVFAPQWLISG